MGHYVSSDDVDQETKLTDLIAAISSEYKRLLKELPDYNQHTGDKSFWISAAVELHQATLASPTYLKIWNGAADFGSSPPKAKASHSTCFCCLFSAPGVVLECGHVLCDACVDDFSEHNTDSLVLQRCPLCDTISGKLNERNSCTLKRDPLWAAPRILSLDGYATCALLGH